MADEDRSRAEARSNRARVSDNAKGGKTDRDVAAKAVLDNMARLKALRLAREAAEPPRPAPAGKKTKAKSGTKSAEKSPALAEWLANQQSGGRRT
jgi:hypothetical protein